MSKLVNSNVSQTGPGGEAPSCWAIFCKFLEKVAILMPFGSHSARFQSHLKEENF